MSRPFKLLLCERQWECRVDLGALQKFMILHSYQSHHPRALEARPRHILLHSKSVRYPFLSAISFHSCALELESVAKHTAE